MNLKEVLDHDQDWDLVFDTGLDNNISNELSQQMITGKQTYGDCLLEIERTMYKMEFHHDERYMRKIACLNNLPTNCLIFIWIRLPVYWFHYLVLQSLDKWRPNFPDWEKHSIPNGHLLPNSASKDDWVEEWMCQLGTPGNYERSFWVN